MPFARLPLAWFTPPPLQPRGGLELFAWILAVYLRKSLLHFLVLVFPRLWVLYQERPSPLCRALQPRGPRHGATPPGPPGSPALLGSPPSAGGSASPRVPPAQGHPPGAHRRADRGAAPHRWEINSLPFPTSPLYIPFLCLLFPCLATRLGCP